MEHYIGLVVAYWLFSLLVPFLYIRWLYYDILIMLVMGRYTKPDAERLPLYRLRGYGRNLSSAQSVIR